MLRQQAIETIAKARAGALVVGIMQSEAPWHDDPASDRHYRRLAEREKIDLGAEFHIGGSNVLPDGKADPTYR